MTIKIETDRATVNAIAWICSASVLIFLIFSIWMYNIDAVKLYTEAGYEEVMETGYSSPIWKKK